MVFFYMHFRANFLLFFLFYTRKTLPNCPSPSLRSRCKSAKSILSVDSFRVIPFYFFESVLVLLRILSLLFIRHFSFSLSNLIFLKLSEKTCPSLIFTSVSPFTNYSLNSSVSYLLSFIMSPT